MIYAKSFHFLNNYPLKSAYVESEAVTMFKPFKIALQKKLTGGNYFLRMVLRIRKPHKGGILIEFTFSIPVCIALLFFVNDHYRFYELKNKIRNLAYLIASMVQHVTNTHTDKQLTLSDLARISYASSLNLFHTNAMFSPYPLGIYFLTHYLYVKKNDNGNYQHQVCSITTGRGKPAVNSLFDGMNKAMNSSTKTPSEIEAIHPDLVCDKVGEERLLIRCYYHVPIGRDELFKSQLGFHILKPSIGVGGNFLGKKESFIYELVISPKPGLFPVKDS